MNDTKPWFEVIAMPALLRHARVTYGLAMRRALDGAGYDDLPKNGLYVIGGLALGAGDLPLAVLIKELRVSKQAAGQLVDMLVLRGYLERTMDAQDRRKLTVTLTERGRAAAAVQAAAREKIDAELLARTGEKDVLCTRRTLAALIDLGREKEQDEVPDAE
jgi:DNA-binding MarR family transcriptional regulator